MRRIHASIGLGAVVALVAATVLASPPEPTPEPTLTPETEPAAEPDPLPPALGFWLSLELIGPRGGQIDAAERMREPPIVDTLPRGGTPPPGEVVGRVDSLDQALAWIAEQAFDGGAVGFGDPGPALAPLPGGGLLRDHDVHLTALVLTGASENGGTQAYPWPPATMLPTPPGWLPATLTSARVPVFAAPGPSLPPASERYQVAATTDAVWQLGALDRCSATGECLRWAQILVRQGDRWFGGWIPAAQIVADREWVAGPEERRFALIASHRDRAQVGYVIVEQRGDRFEPPRGSSHPHAGASWPSANLQVIGDVPTPVIDP